MDRDFGLIHVKLQTWFPLQIQVYVNGHEWLARKLQQHGIGYTKRENAFLWIEDLTRAQKFSDRFCSLDWPVTAVSHPQPAISHNVGSTFQLNADRRGLKAETRQ